MENRSVEQGPIVIRVAVERVDPLEGSAASRDGVELAFHGWLGLLRVFAELLPAETHANERGAARMADPDAGA